MKKFLLAVPAILLGVAATGCAERYAYAPMAPPHPRGLKPTATLPRPVMFG